MAKTFTAEELSVDSGVSVDRIRWLVDIGIVQHREPERFNAGDRFRAKMIDALLEAGVSPEQIESAVRTGSLDLGHVDRYILMEPGPRSERTFAEVMSDAGPRGPLLPSVYKVLGIPQPDLDAHLPVAEEELVRELLEVWRLAPDDEALTRAARMVAEGTRLTTAGWTDLFEEQISGPARERMLRGEVQAFPPEVADSVARVFHLIPRLVEWLTDRYVEQIVVAGIVENLEEYLASRGLAPAPSPGPPPAVAFVDVSGYTVMTERLGDETAARTSDVLRERAEAVAEADEGRVVKLLGDGAMLSFRDPARAVSAAARLVRQLTEDLGVPAHGGVHAGPVIQRDRDLFGRTVNLAARIAGQAGPGEVMVSADVAELAGSEAARFEEVPAATLKGFDQPIRLFRVSASSGKGGHGEG
jgi:adenylate cyclase